MAHEEDGKILVCEFMLQFEACRRHNGWDEMESGFQLLMSCICLHDLWLRVFKQQKRDQVSDFHQDNQRKQNLCENLKKALIGSIRRTLQPIKLIKKSPLLRSYTAKRPVLKV